MWPKRARNGLNFVCLYDINKDHRGGIDMKLIEGSSIEITCAVCGEETFNITLIPGTQRVACTDRPGMKTVIKVTKDDYDNLNVDTWKD
jgi:hypothetical protein